MEEWDSQGAFNDIYKYIREQGGNLSNWYCGITSDWEDRLFTEHKIPQGEDYWFIVRQCHNENDARGVKGAFIDLGCDGYRGGGDTESVYIYAYLKGTMTEP